MLTPSPTMLTGQAALLSPDRLHVLASMGHGDEPVLADASFPAASHARRIVPLIGADAPQVLDAVPGVMPLDDFFDQAAFTMQAVSDLASVPQVVRAFNATLQQHGCGKSTAIERQAVCQRAAAARANVAKPAQVSPADEERVLGLLALLSPRPGLRFVNACETMLAEQAGDDTWFNLRAPLCPLETEEEQAVRAGYRAIGVALATV